MSNRLWTSDGFEFRTLREGRRTTCFCSKRGYEVRISFEPGPNGSPDAIPLEQLELSARNAWLAARHMHRTGLLAELFERHTQHPGGEAPGEPHERRSDP